jgi:tRNA A-37 threonylcarbamoyl transferase component Bud32
VSYQRGKAAHLDVGGRRGEAIVAAIRDQLGLAVLDVKPVGLEGSGGSTPLRIKMEATDDEPARYVFAKLYAKSHVRADRWYKLGRTILYGALEDEKPFQSVRRFVEYEDYTLRLMHELGIPVPRPYGIVEITPEREYMIVMEFFVGAVEIGDAEIDEGVIDQGLGMVRRMWDEGLAHRDIKPANLMVRDGELKLIDVFFVQVRPSPWRQAVDLANMMLVLALRTDAERVYAHALGFFSEDEIAEAFAAARGVASPTQLRNNLKQDGRDLLAEFRRMAPEREQVSIQRWSVRRVLLTIGVLFAAWLAVGLVVSNWNAFA